MSEDIMTCPSCGALPCDWTQEPRSPAWRDEGPVFIQWKGTDVCCDLHCPKCGELSHFDGMFAYHLKCGGCGSRWKMPDHIHVEAADNNATPVLFSIDEGAPIPPEEKA